MLTAADLRYDAATHTTTAPDGRDVPHVTHVLQAVGVSTDFEELRGRGGWLAERIEFRRQLGTAFHADAHAADDGDLAWETVHPEVRPYVEAWLATRAALGLEPVARERNVYHPFYGYAGILDGIFRRGDARILLDLKLGDPADAAAQYQTAAYEAAYVAGQEVAWQAEHPRAPMSAFRRAAAAWRIDERWAVRILPDRTVPYAVTNYSARPEAARDFDHFKAFLTTYRCQKKRAFYDA